MNNKYMVFEIEDLEECISIKEFEFLGKIQDKIVSYRLENKKDEGNYIVVPKSVYDEVVRKEALEIQPNEKEVQ